MLTVSLTSLLLFTLCVIIGASASVLVGVLAGVSICQAVRKGTTPTQPLTDRIVRAFKKQEEDEEPKPPFPPPPHLGI